MIYLAQSSSHSDPAVRQWRLDAARKATASLVRTGLIVLFPIAHSYPLTQYNLARDGGFWQRHDRAHLEACSEMAILTLDGWKEGTGVNAEIRIAAQLRLPVLLIDPTRLVRWLRTPRPLGPGRWR